ncbi:unnamed protein product [Peronospora destructor]|nr:unnamed protein product [Peronospora destructor]
MLAFAFIPAAIVAFVVREKNPNQNAKSLQLICGANVSAYWLSTWTHDIVIMMVTVIASMIMVPFSDRTLKSSMEVWGIVSLIGSHALAVIPMAYLFSFKFKEHAVAQTSLLVFAICTGGLLSIFSFLCRLIDFNLTPSKYYDQSTLSSLDRNYLMDFYAFPRLQSKQRHLRDCHTETEPKFAVRGTLKKEQQQPRNEDDDVARERRKVEQLYPTHNDIVFIRNLRQRYGSKGKLALDDLCLSIAKGECFGYLGTNGAGKSTTMKVLTGEIAPTNGFVTLGGYDLAQQLELYAQLKGIPSDRVKRAVDQKIEELDLVEYRTKLTQRLSGGNKRKVSAAIALIGSPRIIFLDEPSTGVDPSSRRKMWDVIASVCATKESCVVLITHSMEECEALCTRVGILVNGNLKCLGSVEHLKQKFGRRYIVEVKMQEPSSSSVERLQLEVHRILEGNSLGISQDHINILCSSLGVSNRAQEIMDGEGNGNVIKSYLETSGIIPIDVFCAWWHTKNMGGALQEFFYSKFPGCQLLEHQSGHFRFQVPKQSLRPYVIFGLLEENKEHLHIDEYGVSETSLEHIFNTMAAQQGDEQLQGSIRYRGA